jgi:hypothetical protein
MGDMAFESGLDCLNVLIDPFHMKRQYSQERGSGNVKPWRHKDAAMILSRDF